MLEQTPFPGEGRKIRQIPGYPDNVFIAWADAGEVTCYVTYTINIPRRVVITDAVMS